MGVYIYSVRTREIAATLNGEAVVLHPLSYLCKVSWFSNENAKHIAKAEAVWGTHNSELKGMLVVLCDKTPKDGDQVIRYRYDSPCPYDTDSFGEVVGYMRKVGRKWTVVSTVYRVSVVTKCDGFCYHTRMSSPVMFDNDAVATWGMTHAGPNETVQVWASQASV